MPIDPDLLHHFLNHFGTGDGVSQSIEVPRDSADMPPGEIGSSKDSQVGPSPPVHSTAATTTSSMPRPELRMGTPSLPQPPLKSARGALVRSQTWAGEPTSDAAAPDEARPKLPRSGSGAKRQTKVLIKEKLDEAISKGQLPTFCNNCGQIETPAWRHAYTRIVIGTPQNVEVSSKGNAIVAYEILNPSENEGAPHYRIFKNDLDPDGSEMDLFTNLTLCNPCGLWLSKKNEMRPREVWGKTRAQLSAVKARKRHNKKKAETDLLTSDAVIPESDSGIFDSQREAEIIPALDGATAVQMQPLPLTRSESIPVCEGPRLDEPTARAALERAFQSSPVGVRSGSKDTPINVDGELTPRNTRRLLFPSPRRPGEVKSLADSNSAGSLSPRSNSSRTARFLTHDQDVTMEDGDKENCPPPADTEDHLAHLFESPKITPTKGCSLEDLLKTPTPGSRQRIPLTPMRHADVNLTTPSKSSRTPRGNGRIATIAPETPFTRQLNDLLSDSMLPGSPSQNFDLSAFATFTPGRNSTLHFGDFLQNDPLSSDLPVSSSSPPKNFDFSVFEDPNTSTIGLWSGASIFDVNDAIMSDAPDEQQSDAQDGITTPKILTINGISLDFSSMIEEVIGNVNPGEQEPGAAVPSSALTLESSPDPVPAPVPTPASAPAPAPVKPLGSRPDLVPPPVTQTRTHPPIPPPGEYDPPKPRCQRCKQMKKGCDRGRPCGRCIKAGLEEDCIPVVEESATSPTFSANAEQTRQVPWQMQHQPGLQVGKPSIPVDPALEAMTVSIGPTTHEASRDATEQTLPMGEAMTAQARSPSVTNDGKAPAPRPEVKQEVITPKAVDADIETAPTQPKTTASAPNTPDDLNTV
jgi:hypothetical protein